MHTKIYLDGGKTLYISKVQGTMYVDIRYNDENAPKVADMAILDYDKVDYVIAMLETYKEI